MTKKRKFMLYLLKYVWLIVTTVFYVMWLYTQYGFNLDNIIGNRNAMIYAGGLFVLLMGSTSYVLYVINRALYNR